MKGRIKVGLAGALAAAAGLAGTMAFATGGDGIRERLTGYEEDPLVLSTTGSGHFKAWLDDKDGKVHYRLGYKDLEGDVTQAHIHLGGRHQSGGIIVFLCSNVGGGPPGTQACPPAPARISGTLTAAEVVGPAAQGIDPGEFEEFVAAVEAGVTYANLHTSKYPGGEIRAQLADDDDDHGHDGDSARRR
jgi:hypothetical protein